MKKNHQKFVEFILYKGKTLEMFVEFKDKIVSGFRYSRVNFPVISVSGLIPIFFPVPEHLNQL